MSYIGNQPISAAFLTDTFSGNGSTVAFTMSVAPANTSSILVAVTGVVQDPSTYSVSGTTLTFSAAPPSGTSNISVRYLGIPASGVTTTAYRTQTEFTATAGQTTFTVPSYTVGYIDVYRNGLLLGSADFTATTGTTVVLTAAASAGDFIETVSFYVSSVLNAIQQYNGLSVNQVLTTPTANTLTSASGSNLQLQTNGGTTAMTLDTSGNAGLGVTPSAWESSYRVFDIGTNGTVYNYANGAMVVANNLYVTGGVFKYKISSYAPSLYAQSLGQHIWYYAASGTAGNTATLTQAMTLDSSGNLGVGVTTQSERLRLGSATAGQARMAIEYNGSVISYLGSYSGVVGSGNATDMLIGAANTLAFASGGAGTERARITSSGGLWVGTTTRQSTSNSAFIQTTAGDWTANFQCNTSTASSNLGALIYYSASAPNGLSAPFLQCSDNAQNRLIIYSNGTVNNWTGGYAAFSDIKLKENIVDTTPKLEKLMQVRIRNYNLIGDDTKMLGVVAQELESVFPNMIDELPDYEEVTTTDEEGNEQTERVATGTTTKSVKYSIFVPMLIKAMQEQQAIIAQLQADVAALKGQA